MNVAFWELESLVNQMDNLDGSVAEACIVIGEHEFKVSFDAVAEQHELILITDQM